MILTGPEIFRQLKKGDIRIDPFIEAHLNPASVDLTLGDRIFEYENPRDEEGVLDARAEQKGTVSRHEVGEAVVLFPGKLYLAHTVERVWSSRLVPVLDGKSSIGRLGVSVHQTAGYGDPGFDGQYTLEVTVVYPTRLYIGMRIAQIRFHASVGDLALYKGRYVGDAAQGPVPSRLHLPASLPSSNNSALAAPALPPAKYKNPHDAKVARGQLVDVHFKTGTGKTEKLNKGDGLVLSVNDRYVRVRVFGGTAMPNVDIDIERASADWSLRYP